VTKEDVFNKLVKVLAGVSTADPNAIKKSDKLKVYVPPPAVLTLALAVDRAFPKVDLTDLANSLYDPIAKVGDLVDYIDGVYNG
jgi:hypothetical protein